MADLGGVRQTFRSRELVGAMSRAKAQALVALGQAVEARMRADAHVISGELRDSVYAIVQAGPAGAVDVGVGRFRAGSGRFVSAAQAGPITLSAGSTSDHGTYELLRGGSHDWLHPAIDAGFPTLGERLRSAMRGQGW
jgi:hypothetical protein